MLDMPQQATSDLSRLLVEAHVTNVEYFDGEKEKGGLRDWTADKVEKIVTGFYKIIEKIDIETYEGRQKVIKQLKKFYNNRFPKWLKDSINQTVNDLEELKDGTIDGIRAANIKKRWRELFRIRPDKQKSKMEIFQENYADEIDRVTGATDEFAQETNQEWGENITESGKL